jgi:hypothetical protein
VKTGGRLVKARAVLLVAAGREPSDAATIRKHGAADRCAASTGGVEFGGWQIKILAKKGGGTERCAEKSLGPGQSLVLAYPDGRDGAPRGRRVDRN